MLHLYRKDTIPNDIEPINDIKKQMEIIPEEEVVQISKNSDMADDTAVLAYYYGTHKQKTAFYIDGCTEKVVEYIIRLADQLDIYAYSVCGWTHLPSTDTPIMFNGRLTTCQLARQELHEWKL